MADTGKRGAGGLAAQLNRQAHAVRCSGSDRARRSRVPGQLTDIKGADRRLRANAAKGRLDPSLRSPSWASSAAGTIGDGGDW